MAPTDNTDPRTYSEEELFEAESKHIENSRSRTASERQHLHGGKEDSQPYCGLALSGGGIRAAAFHLGVLQAMAGHKLLPWVDYISSVSGGSFIAGWMVKWLHDVPYGSVMEALSTLSRDGEPERVHQLRQNTGYLTPRLGPLGQDTVLFIATYLHQLFIYLLMLSLFGMLMLLYPDAAIVLSRELREYGLAELLMASGGILVATWGSTLMCTYYIRSRVRTLTSAEA